LPPLSPIFQHSSIPFFHSDGINRLPLINLYFQEVVEFPRRKIIAGGPVFTADRGFARRAGIHFTAKNAA